MEKLIGAAVFGQSGGPTAVINSSAAGVFTEALAQDCITAVYGMDHGIKGLLDDRLIDISQESAQTLDLLKVTPAAALGSVRYRLKDFHEDETDYLRILEIFKKYNIRYFFYNGGNDSMDTCSKVNDYMKHVGYECRVIGVPKTIDNDLIGTDHCPGYGSAAKYISTSIMEIFQDIHVYERGSVCVVEIMGRNSGWLTASAALPLKRGMGADLVYLPETDFDMDRFLEDTKEKLKENGSVIVAVSEGIHFADGTYVASSAADVFGHRQLGGVASILAAKLKEELPKGVMVRGIELSLLQRCAMHCASKTDVEEAFLAGKTAVSEAVNGNSGYCIGFGRAVDQYGKYVCVPINVPLSEIANAEKKIPKSWINKEGNNLEQPFFDYALPLLEGKVRVPETDGLPIYAKLKKVIVSN